MGSEHEEPVHVILSTYRAISCLKWIKNYIKINNKLVPKTIMPSDNANTIACRTR